MSKPGVGLGGRTLIVSRSDPARPRALAACTPTEVVITDAGAFAGYAGQPLVRFDSLDELMHRFELEPRDLRDRE